MSSSPIRVTESSRNYGYNPCPVKAEGLRRPPSKTSMHQSRRLMASAQSNPDVSDLSQAVPYPAFCFIQSLSKGTFSPHQVCHHNYCYISYFSALTSCLIFLHPASNLAIVWAPFCVTIGKSRDSKGPSPFTLIPSFHPSASPGHPDTVQQHRKWGGKWDQSKAHCWSDFSHSRWQWWYPDHLLWLWRRWLWGQEEHVW